MRCVLSASLYNQNSFITLTYDEKRESYHNNFDYTEIQKFKKDLRSYCKYYFDKKIQIFNVHEYGKNGKKHWHLVVFNHDFQDKKRYYPSPDDKPLYTSEELEDLWDKGFCTIGDVTEASAMYQAQYMQKDFQYGHAGTLKKSHSKHSGIGRDYFLQHYHQILSLGYIPFGGGRRGLPRYFERLAHKHYSYFYDRSYFYDTTDRKKRYTIFPTDTEASHEIAELFIQYSEKREKIILEKSQQWQENIKQFIFTKEIPPFRQAAINYLHDLKNRNVDIKF